MSTLKNQPTEPFVPEAQNGRISLSKPFTIRLPAFETEVPYTEVMVILHAGFSSDGNPHQAMMRRDFATGDIHEQTFNNTELVYPFVLGDRVGFLAYLMRGSSWEQIPAKAVYTCAEEIS